MQHPFYDGAVIAFIVVMTLLLVGGLVGYVTHIIRRDLYARSLRKQAAGRVH